VPLRRSSPRRPGGRQLRSTTHQRRPLRHRRHRSRTPNDFLVESKRLSPRRQPDLRQRRVQTLELAQRSRTIASIGVSAHQRAMRFLIRGLLSHHLLPPSTGPQPPQIRQPQPLTRPTRPLGIPIFRQQLPAVQRRVTFGLKALNIRLHHRAWCKRNPPAMNHHRIRFANRAAGEMRRLVQVRQRRVIRQLRPKRLDHLLAMQPMRTRQRKHLHQLRTTTMLPSILRHRNPIPQHLKPTQQAHLKALHRKTIFSPDDSACKSAQRRLSIRFRREPDLPARKAGTPPLPRLSSCDPPCARGRPMLRAKGRRGACSAAASGSQPGPRPGARSGRI